MMMLSAELKSLFFREPTFADIMHLQGEVYRQLENRRTQRVVLGHAVVFVKQHFGIGWKEIFKNIFQLRLPAFGAKNEWLAIQHLRELNIPTLEIMGYGSEGSNPAKIKSFLITRELPPHQSLEDLTRHWKNNPPKLGFKWQLIREVARMTRIMHESGMNHRDFYLCHLVLENKVLENLHRGAALSVRVIDLHRAQLRRKTPTRWIIKDLAGLYFSSMDIGLTKRDRLRFIKEYRNKSLEFVFNREKAFWLKVKNRGDKLYQEHTK